MFEQSTVFEAKTLGYVTTRIPALVARESTLLAFGVGRHDWHDWSHTDILLRRSVDGGATWQPLQILVQGKGAVVDNPTPLVTREGRVHLLYQQNYEAVFHLTSDDGGQTWTTPRDITAAFIPFRNDYAWQVVAPGPGHAIQHSSGRLLVPLWLCNPTTPKKPPGDHRPSCVATIYSDDDGRSWQRGAIVADTTAQIRNPSENVLVELSDGRVMMNIRSESTPRRRLISTSADGATQWTTPQFHDALYDPVCMASSLRGAGPADHPVLLFCNPDSGQLRPAAPGAKVYPRQNGVLKASFDDGKSWPIARVLETSLFGYSDLAQLPDGTLCCLYETGTISGNKGTITHLACTRFSWQWLLNGQSAPL
jgi:sialidase-1